MKRIIKARFDSRDDAEFAISRINALCPSAKCSYDMDGSNGIGFDGLGVLPFSISGAAVQTSLLVPVFPENRSYEKVNNPQNTHLLIKCPPENAGELRKAVISCGGIIGSD